MIPISETQQLEMKDYMNLIKEHMWLVIIPVVAMLGFVFIYHITCTKIYKATATITIERQMPKVTEKRKQDVYGGEMRDNEYYQSQYDLLKSFALANKVIKKLDKNRYPELVSLSAPDRLISMIDIAPVKDTMGLVRVSIRNSNPEKAAELANILAQEFINQGLEKNAQMTGSNIDWLNKQIAELKEKLQSEQKELNAFMEKNKITSSDKDVEAELRDLKSQKMDIQREINTASKIYGEDHPNFILLKDQLGLIEKKIKEEEANLMSFQGKMADYNLLKKRLNADQGLYDDFLDRSRELEVFKGLGISNIRILDAAKVPVVPIIPRPIQKDITVNLLMGIMLGVGLCLFFEFMDNTLRTAEEVIRFVKVPFLGSIPTVSGNITKEEERNLIVHFYPDSQMEAAYDLIATSILFASPEDRPPKSVLIASAVPLEGRSFVASNLAITFANFSERVVLIDMNMRKPSLHMAFKVDQGPGLSDFLTGSVSLADILKPTSVPNLSVVPAGKTVKNPAGLIASENVHFLLTELKQKFERIIINSAPILSAIDTLLLTHIVDGVVMVIRSESTRFDTVIKAKEKILGTKGKIVGAIINNIPPDKRDMFYYYRHSPLPQKKTNKG